MKKLNCILLIDDNPADNYFHKMVIEEMNIASHITISESGEDALAYLKDSNNLIPDLIFLDINMPKMSGWDFLKEFNKLKVAKKNKIVVVVLATLNNPNEINRSPEISLVANFELKPLSKRTLGGIMERHFNGLD